MPRYEEFVNKVGTKAVELTQPAQDAYVDFLSTTSETLGKFIPTLPASDLVPTQRAIVETGFDLAQTILSAQRVYVSRLLDAAAPVTSKFEAKSA
jgi:hypothetical protein